MANSRFYPPPTHRSQNQWATQFAVTGWKKTITVVLEGPGRGGAGISADNQPTKATDHTGRHKSDLRSRISRTAETWVTCETTMISAPRLRATWGGHTRHM